MFEQQIYKTNLLIIHALLMMKNQSILLILKQIINYISIFPIAMKTSVNKQALCFIFIKKDREKEYDQKVSSQWRDARSQFFTQQTLNAFNGKFQEEIKNSIIGLYSNYKDVADLGISILKPYLNVIQQLNHTIKSIQEQFSRKEKECFPLIQIIQEKISSLKVIHIQYDPYINRLNEEECHYSISAFDLFKIVHDNKQMAELTLKGVQVLKFNQFIKAINPYYALQNNEIAWIRHFNSSKPLKLSIFAVLLFRVVRKEQIVCQINDLRCFMGLFQQVSDIKVIIKIQKWSQIYEWKSTLWNLWSLQEKQSRQKLLFNQNPQNQYHNCPLDVKQIQLRNIFLEEYWVEKLVGISIDYQNYL